MTDCVFNNKDTEDSRQKEVKSSRREQILEAAFDLTRTSKQWSLGEVANRIGVSKTALYRHFKNKAEIEEEMNARFLTGLSQLLENTETKPDALRKASVSFFRKNNGYLFFVISNMYSRQNYEDVIFEELRKRSKKIELWAQKFLSAPEKEKDIFTIEVMKNIASIMIASFDVPRMKHIQNELMELLKEGFSKRSFSSASFPNEDRLLELEKECLLVPEDIDTGNKVFNAIAAAIHEYGIGGTTIRRIAEKMGGAKSSLYFYFDNKEEMLLELVRQETDTILQLFIKRSEIGKTFPEQLFIIMMIQANYLMLKPDFMPVFSWIRYETINIDSKKEAPQFETAHFLSHFKCEEVLGKKEQTIGRALAAIKWASMLSTTTITQGQRHNADPDRSRKNIRLMFQSMMSGDRK